MGKATIMISVVVVTYNSQDCLGRSFDALSTFLPEAEKIIVDNASTDRSREIAEQSGARVIALNRNLGFGRACNIGTSHAEQAHILFLNPDVAIRHADTAQLARLLAADDFGLVVPRSSDDDLLPQESPWMREALSLTLGTLAPRELPTIPRFHRVAKARWASGAALLVRRAEFLDIGGFDASYFLYYEDRELSLRYREAGLRIADTLALGVDHVRGASTDLGDRRSSALAFALMGWLQYMCTAHGPRLAARAWRITGAAHNAIAHSVGAAADVIPSARLQRKSIQLSEVRQELSEICGNAGILAQSDDNAYWPDAVRMLRESVDGKIGFHRRLRGRP